MKDYMATRSGQAKNWAQDEPYDFKDRLELLKRVFDATNDLIAGNGGWITSIPGQTPIRFEVRQGDRDVLDLLAARGHQVYPDTPARGQRIVPNAFIEHFVKMKGSDELEPITLADNRPIARTISHPGLVAVDRFVFDV